MMAVLQVERGDGYAVVTLNRPEAMNALSAELRTSLARTVRELEVDPDIRVLILTGAGERAFTAGLDLKELGGGASISDAVDVEDPVKSIAQFSGPVIGAINGVAITGGFELALACDVLIAADTARFADTHARVGIMPGWGLSQKLSRAIGIYRAKELSLTGNFLSAQQAADWGLVNRVVSQAELLPTAKKLAADMLTTVPEMLVGYKKLIDDGFAASFGDGLALEAERARANGGVTAEEIERRREGVRARGQAQQG
ncbi:enoyl-CoA hydratase [Sphingoaurantiacus capsulatus]|uniref:Enoyl-CoA hydratase n=1 Tax=Sphingoaurantiacus capsulatus TaxID=1771310 RepID=A0ABV7X8W6_9SPHN